jgi:hypothetical protein
MQNFEKFIVLLICLTGMVAFVYAFFCTFFFTSKVNERKLR